jgi:hypothetical protein
VGLRARVPSQRRDGAVGKRRRASDLLRATDPGAPDTARDGTYEDAATY